MVVSMTGFGRGEFSDQGWKVTVELKTVNHRYLDVNIRTNGHYFGLEEVVCAYIKEKFSRGRIDLYIKIEELEDKERMVKLDKALLQGYIEVLREIQNELPGAPPITLDQIIRLPEVIQLSSEEIDVDELSQVVLKALEIASLNAINMRGIEGQKLAKDIQKRLESIRTSIQFIEQRAPFVVTHYQEQLLNNLNELLKGTSLSEERFLQEIAIFADRCNIDEEIVRFSSHVEQFSKTLKAEEPVGRKLDFLIQEMNREINTIGSKANDLEIAKKVVEVKSELEKIREQVQNIE